ncbi:FecR family protein [Persicitalea jodogahamensis]|uniref:Uncharacterized protein n=1 Tax=Persicitalea jodogahamensis TaxID=402147 RepID=A0A8J3GB59_9BACT|nr:FecR domain-containing protein [Persicitalea jodogahamensis]GHB79749.1 hypothetical protein GCM10007390_37370 [Persicitalea jodogahamensis]
MKSDIPKHTLFEYLAGRATPLEKKAVEEWLKVTANAEYFHRCVYEWELQSPQYQPDGDRAFARLMEQIEEEKTAAPALAQETAPRRSINWRFWSIAASITLLLSASAWLLRRTILYKNIETGYGQTVSFNLSDGSHVTLNANSALSVPRFGFDDEVREVMLKGEAEFLIRHTPNDQRFVVKTSEQFQVEVLGTEFTVFARPRGTRVALNKGKIRLDYQNDSRKKKLLMNPGELVTLDPEGRLTRRHIGKTDQEVAWKEHRFAFDNTSVLEICAIMMENFGVVLQPGSDEIATRTITGNFKAETAEELLMVLVEVLNLRIQKENGRIVLTTKETISKPL